MNFGMGYDPDIDSDTNTEELSSMRVLSCTHPPSAMNSQTIRDFDDDFLMDGEVCVFGNRNNMPMKAVFHNDLLALEQTELERETQEELAIFDFFGQNFNGGKQERFADEDDGGDNIKYELDREYANPEQGNQPRRRWFRTQNIGFNDIVSANIRLLKSNVNRIVTERFLIPQNREVLSIKQLLESSSAGAQKCQTGSGSKSSPFSVGDDFDFNFVPATLNCSTSDNPTSSASLFDSGVEGLPHHLSNLLVPISILDWYPNFANECTKVLADSGLINRVALARAKATMKSVFHGKGATARLKAQSEDFILKLTANGSIAEPTETRVITAKQLEEELSLKNSKTELSFRPYIVAAIMHVLRNKLALFLTTEKVLGYIDRHMEGVNTNTDDSCSIIPPKHSGGPNKKSRNNGNHYVGRRLVLIALTSIQAAPNDSDAAVSNTAEEHSETTATKTIQLAKQLLTQFSRCIVCGGVIAPYRNLDACSGHSFVPQIFDNNKIYAGISLFQPHPVARALLGLIQVVGSVIACLNKPHLQPHTNGTNGTSSSQATEENRNFVVGSSVAKLFVSAVDRAETFLTTVSDAACVFPNHTAATTEAQNVWQSPHFQYRLQSAIEALYCADPAELALVALYHSIWSLLEEEGGAKFQPGGPLPVGDCKQQGVPDKLRRDRMLKSLVSVLKPANKSTQSEDSKITAHRSVYHLLLSTVFYSTFWYSWGPSATGIAANPFVNVNFVWLKRTALLCKALASGGGNSSSSSSVGNIPFETLYAASLSNGTVQSNKPKIGTLELPFDTRIIALSEAGSILMNTAHKFSCHQQQRRCACRYCGEVIGPPTAGADSKLSNYYAYRQIGLVPQPIPQTADENAVFESSTSKRRLVERGRSNERVAILPSQVPPIPNHRPNASITATTSPAISPMPPLVDIGSKRTREESIMVEHRTRGGRSDTDEFDFFNEETSGHRSHSKRTRSVEPSGFGRDLGGEMPPPRYRGLPPPPPPSPSDTIGIPQQMLATSKWNSPFGIFASTPSPPPPPVSLQIGVEPVEQFSPQVTPVGGNGNDMLNMSFANLPPFLLNVAPKRERTSASQEHPQHVARSQQRQPNGGSLFGGPQMDSGFFHHFGVGSFVTIHLDNNSGGDMDRVAQSYVQNN